MALFDVLGAKRGGGISPVTLAVLGLLAYRTFKSKGQPADASGRTGAGENQSAARTGAGGLGGLLSGLGGGLGGLGGLGGGLGGLLAGGGLSGGLQDLLDRFRQGGLHQKAQSWVSTGPNDALERHELEQTLGEERIAWLVEQTGMPRDELLTKLSGELPAAIDELTPDGRVPSDDEIAKRVSSL